MKKISLWVLLSTFIGAANSFSQTIKVLSPNGGEKWNYNDFTKQIKWQSTGVETVRIDYSLNDGTDWEVLQLNVPSTDGENTFTLSGWNPTLKLSDHFKVRVRSVANSAVGDESDAAFISCFCPTTGLEAAFTQSRGATYPYSALPNVHFPSSVPFSMVAVGTQLVFTGYTAATGYDLFRFDGVNPPQAPVNVLNGQVDLDEINHLFAFNGQVYFSAKDLKENAGVELWKYDLGQNLVSRVADIAVGPASSHPKNFGVYQNKLYFAADNGVAGEELWVYDGANAPQMALDLGAGDVPSMPAELTVFKDRLYFTIVKAGEGGQLWSYDGTTAFHVTGVTDPEDLVAYKSNLFFSAPVPNDATTRDLWLYDGGETLPLPERFPLGSIGFFPEELVTFNGKLYFRISTAPGIPELFELEEHEVGGGLSITGKIATENVFHPRHFAVVNNKLYFQGVDHADPAQQVQGEELWVFDGQTASLVHDLKLNYGSNPTHLTALGNKLYFKAESEVNQFWALGTDLDVLTPNGGEVWLGQSKQTISWKALGVERVHLEYSMHNPDNWTRIASDVPTGAGKSITYQWNLPDTSGMGWLRILDANNNAVLDVSDQPFRITNVLSAKEEVAGKASVKIFPNPSQGKVRVLLGEWNAADLVVQSSLGKVVHVQKVKAAEEINISHLAKGTYLLRLVNEDGKQQISRLVLQ
ncbi:MAG: T9SS type A sorting domain-containing protein [Rufibacter sp.]